jgi:N-acetylglucosaminyldiphosphoundecaprenol N-acetyl-beta-D-mannosaminyltransferase
MYGFVRLLGLDFADVSTKSAAALLASRTATAPFTYVVTPNADHLARLRRRPELRPLYEHAKLRLLDSRVVALMARAIGFPTPQVVPGSDLTEALLRHHLATGERVTIIGLKSEWLPQLVARCGITPPAHYDPPRGFEHNPEMMKSAVDFVLAHPARFIFLAVGSPRQEMLAEAIRGSGCATGVGLCVGASLEFLAGARRRAPQWMQRCDLEWLFRLASDPLRMAHRYLVDSPAVIPMLLRERLSALGSR